jgi:hypothetical protein
MWPDFLARTVFSVGGRTYQWADVVLSAMERGQWSAFARALTEGVACGVRADAEDDWPDDAEVDRAGSDFRYAHDLLAAADMTAWLAGAGLSLEDWFGFLQRLVMRTAWRGELSAIVDSYPPSAADLFEAAPVEGLCSGTFRRMAQSLAGRVAVAERAAAATASDPPSIGGSRPADAELQEWFPSWPAEDLRARAAHLQDVSARFEVAAREALTPSAVEACLHEHFLDWMHVKFESISCRDQSTAHEVQLCVREDGMRLSDAAAASGGRLMRGSLRLEEFDSDRRGVILSARHGELLGPFSKAELWDLVMVLSKHPPTLNDPEVRRLAEAAVVAGLVAAASGTVDWHVQG